jgi:hypothetical protein
MDRHAHEVGTSLDSLDPVADDDGDDDDDSDDSATL